MEKSLHKRRETKQFQTLHDDDKRESKQPIRRSEITSKDAEHNEAAPRKKVNARPAPRDIKVSTKQSPHGANVTSSRDTHVNDPHGSHKNAKKVLKNEKEAEKSHLVQSDKPTRSRDHEHPQQTSSISHHSVQKTETQTKSRLTKKKAVIKDDADEDISHDNLAFKDDESCVQDSAADNVDTRSAQTYPHTFVDSFNAVDVNVPKYSAQRQENVSQQKSKYLPDQSTAVHTSEMNEIARFREAQRQENVSQQKSKYLPDHSAAVHTSEMNEIARFKDINYGSCIIADHPQHNTEQAEVNLFHHDDVIGSTTAEQCGSTQHAGKNSWAEIETLQNVNIGQFSNTNGKDAAMYPAPTTPEQMGSTVQKPETSSDNIRSSSDNIRTIKSRKLPSIFNRKPDANLGAIKSHGRSNSLVPFLDPNSDLRLALQSSRPVGRSQSMRLPSSSKSDQPKKLLRELSFSDADTDVTRNYGSLRGTNSLPRRHESTLMKREATIMEEGACTITPEVKTQLLNLMQELLVRGKIHQVAVLDQATGILLLSLPAWNLSRSDAIGLIKAAGNTQEFMLKLGLGSEMYTCFKHGADKMVGRIGEKILVAQKTHTCVIVGIADHDTPGSCLYEVGELANALKEKEW